MEVLIRHAVGKNLSKRIRKSPLLLETSEYQRRLLCTILRIILKKREKQKKIFLWQSLQCSDSFVYFCRKMPKVQSILDREWLSDRINVPRLNEELAKSVGAKNVFTHFKGYHCCMVTVRLQLKTLLPCLLHLIPAIEVMYYWDYRKCFLKYRIFLISCSEVNYFNKVFCYKFYR